MASTQVTTWRKYTQSEKKAYQARLRRRRVTQVLPPLQQTPRPGTLHFFADNLGSRVPTARVNGQVL